MNESAERAKENEMLKAKVGKKLFECACASVSFSFWAATVPFLVPLFLSCQVLKLEGLCRALQQQRTELAKQAQAAASASAASAASTANSGANDAAAASTASAAPAAEKADGKQPATTTAGTDADKSGGASESAPQTAEPAVQ